MTADFTVGTVDDTFVEGDETLQVSLTSVSGDYASSFTLSGGTATATVIDNDATSATLSVLTATITEGGPVTNGVFQVSLTGDSNKARTVHYSIGGDATNGSDYGTILSSVVVPAGSSVANVTVTVANDSVNENAESVVLCTHQCSTNSDTSLSLASVNHHSGGSHDPR